MNLIVAALLGKPPEETIDGVDLALKLMMSVFRDRVMVGQGTHGMSTEALARIFAVTVRAPVRGARTITSFTDR